MILDAGRTDLVWHHRFLSLWRRVRGTNLSAASWPMRISPMRATSIDVAADDVSSCSRFSILVRNSS